MGVGPKTYRPLCRLNAVRQELASNSERVGDITARYGIWHLGRFAGACKSAVGELPSQTRSTARRLGP
ncbi:helix-turn-helix domain-containing protein [Mesorhizobium sp. 128a]